MRANSHIEPADRLDEMLQFYRPTLRGHLLGAEGDDPVGFVIDCTGGYGRMVAVGLLALWKGITEDEVEAQLDADTRAAKTPVVIFADGGTWAYDLLAALAVGASAAQKEFDQLRFRRLSGQYLVVVIGSGGYLASCLDVGRPVSDGQHRTRLR